MESDRFQEDFLQKIVNVNWGHKMFAVLQFHVSWFDRIAYPDKPFLDGMPFGSSYLMLSNNVKEPSNLSVSQTLTKNMLSEGRMWNYPPYTKDTLQHHTGTFTVIDRMTVEFRKVDGLWGQGFFGVFNRSGTSTPIEVGVAAFNAGPNGPGYGRALYSPIGSDPEYRYHTETGDDPKHDYVADALIFFNLSKIKSKLPAVGEGVDKVFKFDLNVGPSYDSSGYIWSATVKSYLDKKEARIKVFPATNKNVPLWTYTPESTDDAFAGGQELVLNAYKVHGEINLRTLAVDLVQTEVTD